MKRQPSSSSSPARPPAQRADPLARWGQIAVVVFALLAGPAWLMADPVGGFRWNEGFQEILNQAFIVAEPLGSAHLSLDDFPYIAESRGGADFRAHLWTPHNAHVVPLFRTLTHVLTRLAGNLERLPAVFAISSYVALLAAMAGVGHLVAWETRRLIAGLVAMLVGLSSVLEPAAAWYSASQALWSGVFVLGMLVLLQEWRARGGAWRLVLAMLAAAAAPLVWSGGYSAGPTAFAYLWADGRARCRKAAALPLTAVFLTGLALLAVAGRQIAAPENFHGRALSEAISPARGLVHTAQAVPEVLVFKNLGIDVITTPEQGLVLSAMLLGVWAWSRGRVTRDAEGRAMWIPPAIQPLEAAGGVLALSAFWLAYAARGYYSFASLRDLGWYQAIPELGACLFAAGWWAGLRGIDPTLAATSRPACPSRRETTILLCVILAFGLVQLPLFRRLNDQSTYPLTAAERKIFPLPSLVWWRNRFLLQELSLRQRRFLAKLDQAEARARATGIGRDALRQTFGRVPVPGMPDQLVNLSGVDLLDLPEAGRGASPDRARLIQAFGPLFTVEPEPKPGWIAPEAPWPPK